MCAAEVLAFTRFIVRASGDSGVPISSNFCRHAPGSEYNKTAQNKTKKHTNFTCILASPSPKKQSQHRVDLIDAWIPDRQQELKQFRHLWSVKGWRAHHSLLEAVVPGCVTSEVLGLASTTGFCLWSLWRLLIVPSPEISEVLLLDHTSSIPLEPCQPCQQSFKVLATKFWDKKWTSTQVKSTQSCWNTRGALLANIEPVINLRHLWLVGNTRDQDEIHGGVSTKNRSFGELHGKIKTNVAQT